MKFHHLVPAFLLAALPLFAASDPFSGPQWALLDSKKALQAAGQITLANHPDSDEATVEEKNEVFYNLDGTGLNQDESYVKVLTEKGKRDRRTVALGFQLPYFNVSVAKLEVIRPLGQVIPVDIAANSSEAIDDSQMAENIYDPNTKVLQINIPDLEVGDVIHSVARSIIMRPIMPGEFSDENLFEGDASIRHLVYEVHAPATKPLKSITLKDEVPGTVKATRETAPDGSLVYRWEVSNVPRMFAEPSMPPYENALQRLVVSTTPSWTDVSKWYWNLSKPHLDATSPELKKAVADLTAGKTTDMEKAKALFYYVSQKIRYMGLTPEKDRPGFEPHDVCMTFAKQYGVCRDKAGLLVAMLRTAGLDAYPVLLNVGSKKDREVPDPGFNHAIVGWQVAKGKYLLMDPTDQHARDPQPWYDGDQSYLVAKPDGEDLNTSSFTPPEKNMMRIHTTGVLSAGGKLEATSQLSFEGVNDDIYRNAFAGMKPDDRRRYFEKVLKEAIPGATLEALKVTPDNMLDIQTPITATMQFSVEGMTATGHGKSVVSVPWLGNNLGLVLRILHGASLDKRKYPMQTRVTCGLDEKVTLKLADGVSGIESLPACPPVDDDSISYHQNFDEKNGILNCSRELNLKEVEVPPSEYATLKQTLKELEYDARKSPVLAVAKTPAAAIDPTNVPPIPPVDSNSVILYSKKSLDVTGPHSAIYRVKFARRILTYAGKIGEAEIKINYDPACEDAKFIRGTVTSKTGARQEISPVEINVMDAGWSASAKRYTGGKVLVASLPGVDIGSTIEVEYEVDLKDVLFIGGFEPFQLSDDLLQKTFQLTAPPTLKVRKMISSGAGFETEASSGASQVFRWTAKNIKALPAETEAPPDWTYKPGVAYYVGDFHAYLKELTDTLEDRSKSSQKAGEVARQLAAKAPDKLAAVKAIRDYVAISIRDAGPSFTDLPLRELSAADTTLTDGYGHAADRAILLHAMLAAAGFKPEFVLASELPPTKGIRSVASTFPLPDNFNTPLVKVTLNGVAYYLNDTDQYARLGSTPHDNRLAINLADRSTDVIAAAKDCRDRTETDYSLSFANDGGLHMDVTRRYFGNDYNGKKRFFSELRPEEKKRYYQETVSAFDQGARAVGDLNTQFDNYPGTEKFTVALDNYAVVDGKYLYFDLPFTPSLVQLPGGDRRSLPLLLSHEGTNSVHTEIQLPPGFHDVLIAPGSESLDAPDGGGKVRVSSTSGTGKLVLTDDFETSPAVISPHDYPAMVKVESTIENKSAKVFLLEKD